MIGVKVGMAPVVMRASTRLDGMLAVPLESACAGTLKYATSDIALPVFGRMSHWVKICTGDGNALMAFDVRLGMDCTPPD